MLCNMSTVYIFMIGRCFRGCWKYAKHKVRIGREDKQKAVYSSVTFKDKNNNAE